MINWKVRIKNKAFWLALVPALALVLQAIAQLFGFELKNIDGVSDQVINLINAVFALLAVLGVTIDVSTQGFSDTERTLKAKTPKINARQMKKK